MLAKSKFGKTTFAIDLIREHYKGDMSKGLLLATEIGYRAIDGVYAIPITDFGYASGEDDEQRGFIEVVDELIENKNDIPFRFVIIDTITALERMAIKHTIQKSNREDNPDVRYTDISDIPWGKGYNKVAEEIYEQIERLTKNNFGVFIIGHEKVRTIEQRDGFKYDLITFNVLGKTADIIEREADMIIYGDMVVSKDNNDLEIEDASGGVKVDRLLRFRSDGNILCGTRFKNFPEYIEHDASLFLETFENAILELYDGNEDAVKKAKKDEENRRQKKNREDDKKKEQQENLEKEIASIKQQIAVNIGKASSEERSQIGRKVKSILGYTNYNKSNDLDKLKEILELSKR